MSCDCAGIVYPSKKSSLRRSRPSGSRDELTDLPFAALLFVFALFLAYAPASLVTTGVEVMTDAAVSVGDAYPRAVAAADGQIAAFMTMQVAVAESVGESLALAGTSLGQSAHDAFIAPAYAANSASQGWAGATAPVEEPAPAPESAPVEEPVAGIPSQ